MKPGFRSLKLGFIICLILLLGACVPMEDPESSQEMRDEVVKVLQPGELLGQTFHSRRQNLSEILIWLNVDQPSLAPGSTLETRLYTAPGGDLLASNAYDLNQLAAVNSLTIALQNQNDMPAGDYYLELETKEGSIQILGRAQDAYAQGSLFLNHQPIDGDLSLRTGYSYGLSAAGEDLASWFKQSWLIIPAILLLWLPGRLLLLLFKFDQHLDWGERSAISVGLSIAIFPLLMVWTSLLKLPWSRTAAWLFAIGLVLLYGFFYFRNRKSKINWRLLPVSWPMVALAAVVLLSFGVRLAMIRDMAGPAWVDSVHHALITRLILNSGTLPSSYEPFLQVSTTSYHSGYHSVLAAFTWLSGLKLDQAILIFGQILNALAIFSAYLFTKTFTENQTAGIYAALMVGIFTPMPAYYTSWGRYTQLAGLLILPTAWYFIKKLLDQEATINKFRHVEKSTWFLMLLAALATGGLLLVHYRVLAFLAALVFSYVIIQWISTIFKARPLSDFRQTLLVLGFLSLAALILTLPWWPSALVSFVQPVARVSLPAKAFADFSWSYLNTASGKYVLALAGLGLLWSLVQRKLFGLVLSLWIVVMFFLANLGVFHLPGTNIINNTSVAISLFLPGAVLSGYLIGWVVDGWARLVPGAWIKVYWALICLVSAVFGIIGAKTLMPILNSGTILVRQADLPAIEWIAENIPADETFLINPFLWGYGLFAGGDGGYWISPLAGRNTFPPAALYNYNFTGDEGKHISADVQQALTVVKDPEKLHAFLKEKGINYIFSGVRGGPISPEKLLASPLFRLIYRQNGVSIFMVLP